MFLCLQSLSELTELLSSYSNYTNYRRVYSDCTGFKVPILGVHLKDLISLNEALPDYLEDEKINLGKLQHLYSNISELLATHKCKPPFEANKDLLHLLTVREGARLGGRMEVGVVMWAGHGSVEGSFSKKKKKGVLWVMRVLVLL